MNAIPYNLRNIQNQFPRDRVFSSITLANQMEEALEKGEFQLDYQPQVDFAKGKIVGMEALIRWNRPGRIAPGPAEFIPVAESTGFIVTLGEWILLTACRQAKQWQDAGFSIPVAVNLSLCQLEHPCLVQSVDGVLKESGLSPEFLELEITESMAMRNLETVLGTFDGLRDRGVRFALDDFGAGYSSLSHFLCMRFHTLKIDQAFVRDISRGINREIVQTMVGLARRLGMKTIVEGVETMEQLNILRSLKCSQGQGYLFSRPVPVDGATKLLMKGLPPFFVS